MTDFNRRTVEEFRANGGRAGGVLTGTPLVLIHHIGARSGIEHVTPLAYLAHGDGIAIAASNGGSPDHPAWYHNLKANPAITVELGTERFQAAAEEQTGQARAQLWSELVAHFPDLAKFAASTERTIPLFLLRRATPQPKDQRHDHPERSVPSALPPHCSNRGALKQVRSHRRGCGLLARQQRTKSWTRGYFVVGRRPGDADLARADTGDGPGGGRHASGWCA